MNSSKKDVVLFYRRIFEQNLASGTSGNVSCFDPEEKTIWITPSCVDPFEMTVEDIVTIDLDGNILEPTLRSPSSEWKMHAIIYKKYPNTGAVVHTHSPHATAFSVLNIPIPYLLVEMAAFTDGEIPVSAYGPNGSMELAENVASALEGRSTCLLERHGAVAIGKDLSQAMLRAAYIEDAAKIASIASSIDSSKFIGKTFGGE